MMSWLKKLKVFRVRILFIQLKNVDYYTKEKKITDHDHSNNYVTTQKLNQLTKENFAKILKKANLANKDYITNFLKKNKF